MSDTAKRSHGTYYGDMPCRGCAYWRPIGNYKKTKMWACHYALDNRHSRGCEPGERCEKKVSRCIRRQAYKYNGSTEEIKSKT